MKQVYIHDCYSIQNDAVIEIWLKDTEFSANDWSDTSKLCYSGSRYGVMPCKGYGRYLIIRAADNNTWDLNEVEAYDYEALAINPSLVTLSGMTTTRSNYA